MVSPRAAAGFQQGNGFRMGASLEARKLGSSSIIIRMSAIRKLAGEAVDNGPLTPELAAGISRVKSVKSVGIRTGIGSRCGRRRRCLAHQTPPP